MKTKMKIGLIISGLCIIAGLVVFFISRKNNLDPATLSAQQTLREAVRLAKQGNRDKISQLISALERGEKIFISEKLLPEYNSFLKNRDSQVQLLGTYGLRAISSPKSKKPLINYLESMDSKIFKHKPSDNSVSADESFVQKYMWSWQAVGLSAETLGKVGDKSAIPVLESFKDFPQYESWNPVKDALAKLGSVESFTNITPESSISEKATAASGISAIRDPGKVSELIEIVKDSNATIPNRIAATEALCEIKTSEALLFVFATAKDTSFQLNIRCMATLFLGKIQDKDLEEWLLELTNDKSIKAYAITGLVLYKPEKYFNNWVNTIMDSNELNKLREDTISLSMYIPIDLLRNQRKQLYLFLNAENNDEKPNDQIRALGWRLINQTFKEQPSIVFSNPSSPCISDIKSLITTGLLKSRLPNTSLTDLEKKADEILKSIISFDKQSSEVQI
jgi:HEAT repeat protein